MVHAAHTGHAVHVAHVAHAHVAHTHVGHGGERARTERGHRRDHADLRSERGTRHAGTVPGFGDERIGPRLRLHDHVIGFGDGDLEFVDRHGPHVQAVGLDDRQFQAGDAQVEVGHRRGVDDAQPHPLAGREQRSPIVGGAMAVDQIGVGATGHVGHVGRVHPHRAPGEAVLERLVLAREQTGKCLLLVIEVSALQLQAAEDGVRVQRAVVGQDDHMFAVAGDGIGAGGIDDDRAIMPHLLLQAGMAVIPVSARLADRKAVGKAAARRNAGEADAGHAIHLERQQQAVPVDRGLLVQIVDDGERRVLPFAEAQQRRRHRAVDADRMLRLAVDRHHLMRDVERDVRAGERRQRGGDAGGHGLRPGGEPWHGGGERGGPQQMAARQGQAGILWQNGRRYRVRAAGPTGWP